MPSNDHYVIIGNGPAGNHAADILRENDGDARITIISHESMLFYYKHKLTDYIRGKAGEEELTVRPPLVYKEKNIRLRLGQEVERIDPVENKLYLKHMEIMSYSKLLIASGASPRVLPSVSSFGKHLTLLSSYTDVLNQIPDIRKNKRFLVLGGDLVSFKFIRMLKSMGKDVECLLYADAFWPFNLTPDMAGAARKSLEKLGVSVREGNGLKSVKPGDDGLTVQTESGKAGTYDSIYAFLGMVPNISFVLGSGIDTDRGILVDDNLKTNFDHVYAAGDCAQIYNPDIKSYWLSIGWKNAALQGEVAARNLLGEARVISPSPKKILDVEGFTVDTSWWESFD
jgi:nitrite reductase (NADH) large subunit